MQKNWGAMSADEKQEAQFQKLLAPKDPEGNDLVFQSLEAQSAYKESINRIKAALRLEKSDRVPVCIFPGMYPWAYSGMTVQFYHGRRILQLASLNQELGAAFDISGKIDGAIVLARFQLGSGELYTGDLLMEVNHRPIRRPEDVKAAIAAAQESGSSSIPINYNRAKRVVVGTLELR